MTNLRSDNPNAANNLIVALRGLKGVVGKVGWGESAQYEDGTPVAQVAVVQEYGAPSKGIPPRPFLRPTIAKRTEEWVAIAGQGVKAVTEGKVTGQQVMTQLVLRAAGQVRQTISEVESPPLKESTIKARLRRKSGKGRTAGITKPLIDTGIMIGTLIGVVEKE